MVQPQPRVFKVFACGGSTTGEASSRLHTEECAQQQEFQAVGHATIKREGMKDGRIGTGFVIQGWIMLVEDFLRGGAKISMSRLIEQLRDFLPLGLKDSHKLVTPDDWEVL
mmetsp:Transcript_4918/g.7110  ORF Transcript_4918/g.7110 Transcript_4918/m.7110 type:complete len:111 (+) Transcript_4918:834-1166(+)